MAPGFHLSLPNMRYLIIVLVAGMVATFVQAADAPRKEPTRHEKVYYFEHQLIPHWIFQSKGAFFNDLLAGRTGRLITAAVDNVDEEFAKAMEVELVANQDAVLITFMEPVEPPECYRALVIRKGETFQYVTLEKTEDILQTGVKSVIGEWTAKGSHLNRGPQKYTGAHRFLISVLGPKMGGYVLVKRELQVLEVPVRMESVGPPSLNSIREIGERGRK